MGLQATWLTHRMNLNTVSLRSCFGATQPRKIWGVVHAGGPAPGSNAAIAGAVRAAAVRGDAVVGFIDGFQGALKGDAVILTPAMVSEIESLGGVAIGTSRFNPKAQDRQELISRLRSWGIAGIEPIGGDDTNSTAARISEDGYPVVGVPKTIDNDIPGTTKTHGFDTVVNATAEELRALKRDAGCQDSPSIFIAEIMGRKSGMWSLEAGRSAGATSIFIPEECTVNGIRQIMDGSFHSKDFMLNRIISMLKVKGDVLGTVDFLRAMDAGNLTSEDLKLNAEALADHMVKVMMARLNAGISYGVFVIAEGIADRLPTNAVSFDEGGHPTKFEVLGLGKQVQIGVDAHQNPRLSDVHIADAISPLVKAAAKKAGMELKTVPLRFGYQFRCIDPISSDKNMALAEGDMGINLLDSGNAGRMVSVTGTGDISSVDYKDLPRDASGHLVPRVTDLGGSSYMQAATTQHHKSFFGNI